MTLRATLFRASTGLLLAGTAFGLSACASTLHPAADATHVGHDDAIATVAGVNIVTMTPNFPGIVNIQGAVTPMKVKITNNGTTPIRIRYADFQLKDADGASYSALPLYKIDSSVTTSLPLSNYTPILHPGFGYRGFRVAPYYAGLYPGMPWFRGGFGYASPYGWNYYDTAFADVQLPTPEMRRNVLPEGVLDPGGSLEGWLYFQHVSSSVRSVRFDAAVTSERGASLGDLSIPYEFRR